MIGKFEIIGEWAADGSLNESDERVMTTRELKETMKRKLYELDLQLLLAGLISILGIHQEDGVRRFTLEVHVPLFMDDEAEYDVDTLFRRAAMLEQLKERGYYLKGHSEGYVNCYIEGPLTDVFDELEFVEKALSATG